MKYYHQRVCMSVACPLTSLIQSQLPQIDLFNRFDRIPACDGQTDGQTHRAIANGQDQWLVAWHSGGMPVFRRRTFSVLHSTCSWWVTTYVGKSSISSPPIRPTKSFIFSGSSSSKLQSDVRYLGPGWRHLVNANGVKAGWLFLFVDKRAGGS